MRNTPMLVPSLANTSYINRHHDTALSIYCKRHISIVPSRNLMECVVIDHDAGLNLFRLRLFVTVVERGGYSAAAAALDVSQPSVSFHIRALERLLGAPLVVYRGRRAQPTPEGEELYRTAKAMLRDGDNLVLAIGQIRDGQRGRLLLGASITFEQAAFFERVIGPFYHAHPLVYLSLRFGHSPNL